MVSFLLGLFLGVTIGTIAMGLLCNTQDYQDEIDRLRAAYLREYRRGR